MSDSQADGYKECEHAEIERGADGVWRCAECPQIFLVDEVQELLFGGTEPHCPAGEKA